MNPKQKKKNIIEAGYKAVDELIKVAKEDIVDTEEDVSADRLKNAAATKKLAIFDAFEILNRIEQEKALLENKPLEDKKEALEKASEYLRNRMPFLESNKVITPIHSNMELNSYSTDQKRTDKI